jgi:leader peptidase (prepilin peptidase)/N-methyltransferase
MTHAHHAVLALLFVLIGCSVGSFLNVCAYRIPLRLSLLRPRSRCPRCLTAVCAHDNVPVLGWLMLRGRCRQCGGPISPRYPAVELLTGLSFAGVYLAWVAVAPADMWEQTGAPGVVFRLVAIWSLIGIAELLALLVFDSTRLEQVGQLPAPGRRSEERSGASSLD